MKAPGLALCLGALLCGVAHAEVKASAADAMTLQYKGEIALSRDAAWARLVAVGSWWSGSHTYSGAASNMTLDARAGGCWCETWSGGQVEHGRVVSSMPGQVLRVETALGPLQALGVAGALTFTLGEGASPGATSVTMDYKVSGSSMSGLDALGPVVDQVMGAQFAGLIK